MVIRCCVPGCPVKGNDGFHNFPTNNELRDKWLQVTRTEHLESENLSRKSFRKICKNHFRPDDYIKYASGLIRLKYNSVPSLNLPCEVESNISEPSTQQPVISPKIIKLTEEIEMNAAGEHSRLESNVDDNKTTTRKGENESKDEIRNLKAMLSAVKKKLRYSENQRIKLRKRLQANKMNHSNVLAYLSTVFNKEELLFFRMLLKNAGKQTQARRFTSEEKSFCLALYKQGPRAYRKLRDYFSLPSQRTLGRHSAHLLFETGVNPKLFEYLKAKANSMSEIDRYCIMVWDEMSLKSHLDYSIKRDVIDGFVEFLNIRRPAFATHSLIFMIRGINSGFKQPVVYYFTDGLKAFELAEMITIVTKAVLDAGFKVIGSTSDQVSMNVSAIEILMNAKRKTKEGQLLTYKIGDAVIIHYFDPPHLLKGLRNNLQTKDLKHFVFKRWNSDSKPKKHVNKGLIATWDGVVELYDLNLRASRKLLEKITEQHVYPTKMKMKVSVAAQIFSETCGQIMLHCSEKRQITQDYFGTAQILLFVNDFFDSLNGSDLIKNGELKGAVTKNSVHLQFWEYALRMLSNMRFIDKKNGQVNNRTKVIQNCESTVRGYVELTRKCFDLSMTKISLRYKKRIFYCVVSSCDFNKIYGM